MAVVGALVAATAPVSDSGWLSMAVFLLGYGWNLCWVGGSSLLSRELPEEAQIRIEGDIDALVWTTSAVASFASGGLLAAGGFYLLATVSAAVAMAPVLPLLLVRRGQGAISV